jgi:hypothetical protein
MGITILSFYSPEAKSPVDFCVLYGFEWSAYEKIKRIFRYALRSFSFYENKIFLEPGGSTSERSKTM